MTDIDRVKRELEEGIELALVSTPVDVLVMGPRLTGSTPAALLRRRVVEAARVYGAVIKPEHSDLVAAASAKLGAGHHLTAYEMFLVTQCDLVILIPDSPGSLCELGLFATYAEFSRKLLILASGEYPKSGNYVSDGPLTAAEHNGAEVRYVDYGDFDRSWSHVRTRLERVRVEKNMVRLSGASSR